MPDDLKTVLQRLLPKPKAATKTCRFCAAAARKSAKVCTSCGGCYPECVVCGKVLQYEDKFCSGCGCPHCSYS